MKTMLLKADKMGLEKGAEFIRNGEVVAFPTETVYGLGADAKNKDAVEKIFIAKGRPSDNPLIVHIASKDDVFKIAEEIPEKAHLLMDKFWPGPLTVILKKTDKIPDIVSAGLKTVGIRMPEEKSAREFIALSKTPIAAPSANISGRPSPTTFFDVFTDLNGKVPAIIEGEPSRVGLESTVIDLTLDVPVILRPGGVTKEKIEEVIGKVLISDKIKDESAPKAPGMKYRHYAPRASVQIFKGTLEEKINVLKEKKGFFEKIGILCFDEEKDALSLYGTVCSLGKKNLPQDAANRLFSALRKLDAENVDIIFAPEISDNGLWLAVKNRLYKAAAESIVDKNAKWVLFVCSGNTCRSPMAEGILKSLNKNAVVRSAGLMAHFNQGANEKAIDALKEMGINIKNHRSKNITREMFEKADLIITMTEDIKNALPESDKVLTLKELAGEKGDIPDPFGDTLLVYKSCASEIKRLIEKAGI